jgi:uncharacterized protein
MDIKSRIDSDLKAAMLAGDKTLATTLRGLKSAILYAEVAAGSRDQGLPETDTVNLLAKEAKKRQESADLYQKGGNQERAEAELAEKSVIEAYLPAQLNDKELDAIIDQVIEEIGETGAQAMGKIIAAVKERTGGQADGGRIAAMVKARLTA